MSVINNALNTQQTATNQSLDKLTGMYDEGKGYLSPYMTAGASALGNLSGAAGGQQGQQYMANLEGMNPNVSVNYQQIQADPNYQWTMQQANEQARRALSAQGMLGSRHAVNALGDVGRQVASAESDRMYGRGVDNYNRAYGQQSDLYNMANQNQNNEYNRWMGVAGLGQNAATNLANSGSRYADAYGGLLTGMANAQASGMLSNNALNQQLSQDQNNMWAGLGGIALNNIGGISDAVGGAWDAVSSWW